MEDGRHERLSNGHEPPADLELRRRVEPLRLYLGDRPFAAAAPFRSAVKRKNVPRVREVNPARRKRLNHVPVLSPEDNKPVPRLIPRSQVSHVKKDKSKSPRVNDYTQYLGLQPMVKFKCKCCAMFMTLELLREHQQICKVQTKEPTLTPDVTVSADPNSGGPSRITKKVYLCSACGTYYENWNLFLHMREVHNRHICLFCLGMFAKAEKLSSHLVNKHNVTEHVYDTKEDFTNTYNGTFYLMCSTCEEIISEQDDYINHDCDNEKSIPVPLLVSKNSSKTVNSKQCNKSTSDVALNGSTISNREPCSQLNESPISEYKRDVPVPVEKSEIVPPITVRIGPQPKIVEKHVASDDNCDDTFNDYDNNSSVCYNDKDEETEPSESQFSKDVIASERRIRDRDSETSADSGQGNFVSSSRLSDTPTIDRDCGIKLKLSLNKASSPVIINSTVDPTVGRQNVKPPMRNRRPPKRYERDPTKDSTPSMSPRTTPSIKITICDKAQSPFVKSTIIEPKDNDYNLAMNNNFENSLKICQKPDNTIKSTIYDNNPDDINTLNRVPKLTVRIPKELLDKDSSSDYSSDSDCSNKLTVDEQPINDEEPPTKMEVDNENLPTEDTKEEVPNTSEELDQTKNEELPPTAESAAIVENTDETPSELPTETNTDILNVVDEIPVTELKLDRPLDRYPLKDLLKVFLASTVINCIYCNHVRKIAVNCEQLCLHMVAQHRFAATVDSITAEELLPETITARVSDGAEELRSVYINLDSYDSVEISDKVTYDQTYECFQCYYKTAIHKDLYLHNRKMHQKTIMLCVMCKTNFYSYSELLCHLCPGTYDSEKEIRFRCCLCNIDRIPSSFRLMVHLRKIHHTCDVCLEFCYSQAKLSNHVWKHKLHHLCYRCGIAYRNKPDITKHLFWKHGTESVMCKKCLQKKWPHVYHFCTPPASFNCDECPLTFSKAVCLRVHKRFHSEEFPHVCLEEDCVEKFVSKNLLLKHAETHKMSAAEIEPKEQNITIDETLKDKDTIPIIDLVDDKPKEDSENTTNKTEKQPATVSKKSKKKKFKDLLLDVNLPALNLSESDSSDESDSGVQPAPVKDETADPEPVKDEAEQKPTDEVKDEVNKKEIVEPADIKSEQKPDVTTGEKTEPPEDKQEPTEEKPDERQVLEIWDNFKKYQAKVERQKTPPLVPIRKHVCESEHDYCVVPSESPAPSPGRRRRRSPRSSPRKRRGEFSSSSSSSDSSSSCSCGSNCSCSSSSGSSSSSSDSESDARLSAVDVLGAADTPALLPPPADLSPPVPEMDLLTDESDTDEDFYDEHPQLRANKLLEEKRNQLLLLASVAPSDPPPDPPRAPSKKSKKKKRSKGSKRTSGKLDVTPSEPPQSEPVLAPAPAPALATAPTPFGKPHENKRASKRRRVPNRFYGYSSDEDRTAIPAALKPQPPPKLEWRKEDLPAAPLPPVVIPPPAPRLYLREPVPDPQPPRELLESSDEEEPPPPPSPPSPPRPAPRPRPHQSSHAPHRTIPAPPPHLFAGTSSLPYQFTRPAVRQAREGESVYCYCRCPYDEVSEMIACDADGCTIEWFHFECVGIMVPPKGKWYCPECRKRQNYSMFR